MADADVPITAGSGTKIDTRTVGAGTDEHRQVVVVGDPSTAANVGAVTAAGAQKVDGSAVTQPVSLAAAVTIGAGAAQIGTVLNVGDVDHDAVNTGKVVQVGGHANSEKAPDTEPAAVASGDRVRAWHGLRGEYITRVRRVATYSATYRAAAVNAVGGLTFTHTANTDKQYATLHHAASATKLIRIHRIAVVIAAHSVAGQLDIDVRRITTAPATGNPAITPKAHNFANPATEAVALALPGTAGTVDDNATSYSATQLNLGVIAGATSVNSNDGMMELLNQGDLGDSAQSIELRPGVLEGIAVILRDTAAATVRGYVRIVYTEEAV